MLADDLRRLAEEIGSAYEARIQGIADLKRETVEKLTEYRSDLDAANKDRAKNVQAELKDMGYKLRSELTEFTTQLAGFKTKLDGEEKIRRDETQAEIAERNRYIKGLRDDARDLLAGFEGARKEMWRNMKSQLEYFTSGLTQFRNELVNGNQDRINALRTDLKKMGDSMRSELAAFTSMLKTFKADLDKAESARKEEALRELAERKQDLQGVLGGAQELLRAFENARKEMWADLKGRLEAFTSELGQFKADLDKAESARREVMGGEISARREHVSLIKGDTRTLMNDFENARKEMWRGLKSELDIFTTGLAQFKADLEAGEKERLETVVREMNEKALVLKANLKDFSADLSTSVGKMMADLKKDRSEAAQAWHQILSAVRSRGGEAMVVAAPEAVETKVEIKAAPNVVQGNATKEEPAREEVVAQEPEEERQENIIEESKAPEKELKEDGEGEAEAPADKIGIISNILKILAENPNGLRMVEIAEILGVENWRSLIPVMRELLDDGQLRKEDSTYLAI